MSVSQHVVSPADSAFFDTLADSLDDRTVEILERRRRTATVHRRGWLIRRLLLVADVTGIVAALLAAQYVSDRSAWLEPLDLALLGSVPAWVILAKLHGLYDRDEERTDHSTVDDIASVFRFITIGTWILLIALWAGGALKPGALLVFWSLALVLVTGGRVAARSACRRSLTYLQNTVIVGAGDIGQLVARKFLHHPEYGINLVGFVDAQPKERGGGLDHLTLLGAPPQLPNLVRLFDIERVVIAFSNESNEQTLEVIRALKDQNVQIDIVPRLFEVVGPNVSIHTVEGLPLVGLPPARISRSSRAIKRAIDVVGATVGLIVLAPLFAYIALKIKRDSPGPVFFRQTRLGMNLHEFSIFKFRTMHADTDAAPHREYIKTLMSRGAAPESNGLFKLERDDAVTKAGQWLRRTSLDELPQLINVLRGEMSLVGPRPCIPYETDNFEPRQFERFLVPAGITGLWQVTGRAHTTFGEGLDMDVAYARGWSLGLDVTLILRTLRHLLMKGSTT